MMKLLSKHVKCKVRFKKSQIASMDIVIAILVIFLFLGFIGIAVLKITNADNRTVIYNSEIFNRIAQLPEDIAFLEDYRINETKLANFCQKNDNNDLFIKKTLLSNSNLYNLEDDISLYFWNGSQMKPIPNDPSDLINPFKTNISMGHVYNTSAHTARNIYKAIDLESSCEFYSHSYVFMKPVLRNEKIITMYVVVCKN